MRRPTIAVGLLPNDREAILHQLNARRVRLGDPRVRRGAARGDPGRPPRRARGPRCDERSCGVRGVARRPPGRRRRRFRSSWSRPTEQADALGEGTDLGPDDEIALRPIDGESVRWRVEAMLIRAQTATETSDERGHGERARSKLPGPPARRSSRSSIQRAASGRRRSPPILRPPCRTAGSDESSWSTRTPSRAT